MLNVVDSFVEYLYRELRFAMPVHWVRVTTTDPQSHRLKDGALNVTFLNFAQNGSLEEALVSLDLIGDDERTVWGLAKAVRDKLLEQQFIPELAYEPDPANPMSQTLRMVEWDGDSIEFGIVGSADHYVHLNSTFTVRHAR